MLCNANLQDRAVFVMWSLKVSWSSKITPRFLTELDGVIVDLPNWMGKSYCRIGVAGKTRSSVLPLDLLAEIKDRAVCHQHSNGRGNHVTMCLYDGTQ